MSGTTELSTFSGFKWSHFNSLTDPKQFTRATNFLESVKWPALEHLASGTRGGISCKLTTDIGLGYNHMVRILRFADGFQLVARLRLPPFTPSELDSNSDAVEIAMRSEISTLAAVALHTDIKVPRSHTFETRANCEVGAPFVLMDCLEGNAGLDFGLEIPLQYKDDFFCALAGIHVRLSGIRLPKIGKIIAIKKDGTYEQGAIPGIGGPFGTAAQYYTAWSKSIDFGLERERLRQMAGEYAEEIIASTAFFKKSIADLADMISTPANNLGPFPLIHGDFGHHNILVDDNYHVKGVIDFEFAFAGPWEIAARFPMNLLSMPPVTDAPWNYDDDGNAIPRDLAQKLIHQKDYIKAVEREESRLGQDHILSAAMLDSGRQQLGTALWYFKEGKAGFYGNLIKKYSPLWKEDK